ncbi:tRNA (guanosine(46)-N7)-methyltransferase TrmB [Streptacidiphilus sp. P02-A3a]|uniref:tRNA (guanosine(46)-N7)-methyltransferase TrmB n=1 Tax=Streptacidiphilus sp. P02-A3a TaxID=2704468 RepID=UPI001CDC6D61|nr:tRNA (guanosine(46)-N7)-methyltransferase TrmB [Streptacidiphilus sp. P02-A3a]
MPPAAPVCVDDVTLGTPVPAALHSERRIRSFHPRKGRMSDAQRGALARLWKAYGIRVDGEGLLDLDQLFDNAERPVVLEIGFGMGDATADMAAADPATGILAVDVHTPGHGNLLRRIESGGLENVRLAEGDAVVLLRDQLAPGSMAGLRVYFPDPWPKARHHKRRLIQPEFVALAVSRLRPGALVHCATDWEPYAEQMLEVLTASPELENLHPDGGGYAPRPDWRPVTKFEQQGLDKGHVVQDLLFRRR